MNRLSEILQAVFLIVAVVTFVLIAKGAIEDLKRPK